MRYVMKSVLRFIVSAAAIAALTGCYTELATTERSDREEAYDSDTTYDNGNTTINNNYYLDDNYRQSRLRVSLNYYYPTYSSWIGSYYNSYFDDPYWGMYHRSIGYYDACYPYYPPYGWCYSPYPYIDPWFSYYPPVAYYPGYHHGYYPGYHSQSSYGYTPNEPNRPRTDGSTRDPRNDDRSRPIPIAIPATQVPATGTSTVVRQREPVEKVPVRTPERGWWEKDRQTRVADETPVNRPATNRRVGDRQNSKREDQSVDQPKNDRPANKDRGTQKMKREDQSSTPSVKQSGTKNEVRRTERPRESRQPSYNPPRQSTQSQSPPPRSSGGSSSRGETRKRD